MTVEVVGSDLSAPVEGSGRFTLEEVPPGPVRLHFVGSGVDASLDIGPVQRGQVVTIAVQVSGSTARLESETDASDEVHPAGVVTNLTGPCPNVTFNVGSTVVNTSDATVFDDGGCPALRNGDRVRVDAVPRSDGTVLATEIEVDGPGAPDEGDGGNDGDEPNDGPEDVHPEGVVSELSGSCPNVTFDVDGRTVQTSATTVFDDGGCPALRNGDRVRVDAVPQSDGTVLATEVEVDEPDDPPNAPDDGDDNDDELDDDDDDDQEDVHPEGVVSGLSGSCPNVTFQVNGTTVQTSATTVFDDGGCAVLANGDRVRVDALSQSDGTVLATEVEVDEPNDDSDDDSDDDNDDSNRGRG